MGAEGGCSEQLQSKLMVNAQIPLESSSFGNSKIGL
jgi:hypothetical protein